MFHDSSLHTVMGVYVLRDLFLSLSLNYPIPGNCNPRFMRSTIYVAPQTQELLKHSQLPFAVSISPFAKLNEKEVGGEEGGG